MKEILLPDDQEPHSHILIEHNQILRAPEYLLRFGRLNQRHTTIAEYFALDELEASSRAIHDSNYLKQEFKGYRVFGAGEFRLQGMVFIDRPVSASYNSLYFTELYGLLSKYGYQIESRSRDSSL